ncbi:hypothetical protein PVAP13_9KG076200 [Panicum virgatum]|uniref:Uncharacterized protein n=1 Tax=Panicum virgatum TaxID=38727 RepID=A0A8T0NGD0_PANVG|nr:hypothetical protein PVAP13_9KG076200 [Panicum virgatum]
MPWAMERRRSPETAARHVRQTRRRTSASTSSGSHSDPPVSLLDQASMPRRLSCQLCSRSAARPPQATSLKSARRRAPGKAETVVTMNQHAGGYFEWILYRIDKGALKS